MCSFQNFLLLLLFSNFGDSSADHIFAPTAGCAILGLNATVNKCGYCVGADSGLEKNFGEDCLGVCNGGAKLDCSGVCNGIAYRDECTGECVTDDNVNVLSDKRDCRGACIEEQLTPSQLLYKKDECGVCRLHVPGAKSPFVDCSGKCSLPGTGRPIEVCGRCVTPSQEKLLLDSCGNCLTDGVFCSCERDPLQCGCRDARNCYSIKLVKPRVIPSRTNKKVHLIGYFYPPSLDVNCLFKHQTTGEIITSTANFLEGNRTSIFCNIHLSKEGVWLIGFRSVSGRKDFYGDTRVTVYVYNKDAVSFIQVVPAKMTTPELEYPLSLKFKPASLVNVPNLPLNCIVSYGETQESEITSEEGREPFTCTIMSSEKPAKSQEVFVTPTLDGEEAVGAPMKISILAPVPSISHKNSFITSDGLTIIIIFEKQISPGDMNPSGISLCTQVLTLKTLRALGDHEIKSCVWSSKVQFMIYLDKSIRENLMEIAFNAGVLKEDAQLLATSNREEVKVTVKKLTTEWWSFSPKLIITGPSEVPRCEIFALTAHYSSPRGSSGVQFKWNIGRDGGAKVDPELELFVGLSQKQHLILDASVFEVGPHYTFTLTALSEDGDDGTLIATHRLVRFDYDAPIVSVYSNVMMPLLPLTLNQKALFFAEINVPVCIHPFQKVSLYWKVLDPRVRFNFTLANSPVYIVSPFSVPEGEGVTFFVSAFLGHRVTQSAGAGFTILSHAATLQAVISDGVSMITMGAMSGNLLLTTEGSGVGLREKLVYQWSCVDSDSHQPCYKIIHEQTGVTFSRNRDFLLVNRTQQKKSYLPLASHEMEAGKELIFSLQVSDINDTKKISETEIVLVKVVEGNAPQVFMGGIYVKGTQRVSTRSPHNLAIVVPSHVSLVIKGRVRGAASIRKLMWTAPNFIGSLHWTNKAVGDDIETDLHIHAEDVHPYGVTVVKLEACNIEGECSETVTQFTSAQGVSGCRISVDPYQEFEFITIQIENCNTPPGYSPTLHQLFIVDPSLAYEVPVTTPQFSSVFLLPGPPSPSGKPVMFSAKVCDVYDSCQNFFSNVVEIKASANLSQDALDILDLARKYNLAGDSAASLTLISMVLRKPEVGDFIINKAINAAIEYAVVGLQRPSLILNKGQAESMLNTLSEAHKLSQESLTRRRALDAIQKVTLKSVAWDALPSPQNLDHVYQSVITPHRLIVNNRQNRSSVDDLRVFESGREASKTMIESVAAKIPLGVRIEFGKQSLEHDLIPEAYSVIIHDNELQDITLSTLINATSNVEVTITFGEELKRDFSAPWRCEHRQNCHSVVFSVTIYPNGGVFPTTKNHMRITPVLEVAIHSPISGKEQKVKGYLNAMSFVLTQTGDEKWGGQRYETTCRFWSEAHQSWKTDGVHFSGSSKGKSTCWTGHLTAFTVMRGPDIMETGFIIGMAVATLMVTIFVGLIITYAVHKCQESKTAKISSQHLVQRYQL